MGFGTVFVVHSSGACYYIKDEKAGNFVRLLNRNTHKKRPKSPIFTHRIYRNNFHRPNCQDVCPHSFQKLSWSNTFYHLFCTLENCTRTDFVFLHLIRTNITILFEHVTSQSSPLPYPRQILNFPAVSIFTCGTRLVCCVCVCVFCPAAKAGPFL